MGMVFKMPLTPQQIWNMKTFARLKELWLSNIIGTSTEIAGIVNGIYSPTGSDGEGEKNGVPTENDIEKIIAGTYVHHDVEIDEYGIPFEDVPSEETILQIINGTYTPTTPTNNNDFEGVISDDDIAEIIGG